MAASARAASHVGGTAALDTRVTSLEGIMRRLLVLLMLIVPSAAHAQGLSRSILLADSRFDPPAASALVIPERVVRMPPASSQRARNALIGGVIGAAAGIVICTVISNISDDAAIDRFTTCTAKGYLVSGGLGFAAGSLIGWLGSS